MKGKISVSARFISIAAVLLLGILLASCKGGADENDTSLALIKNSSMSTYGTGFAVGVPGRAADTIVTACSTVATVNGAVPKTANIRIKDAEKEMTANVVYYDTQRNIAILKLSEPYKQLKPVVLNDSAVYESDTVIVRGYDGTGNIMSDFEKFNSTDIVQYIGNIIDYSELSAMTVYKYSNEFNRAAIGAPAVDEKGRTVGMCAYSLSGMNTFSQYVMPSGEIIKCLISQDIEFVTNREMKYRFIIIMSLIAGIIILAAIVILAVLLINKGENNPDKGLYIKITDGALKGQQINFEKKLAIGRDKDRCNVIYPINEPGISGLHCTIEQRGDGLFLTDNSSSFGTFLENGTRIDPSSPYKIEKNKFVFYIAEPKNRIELYIR